MRLDASDLCEGEVRCELRCPWHEEVPEPLPVVAVSNETRMDRCLFVGNLPVGAFEPRLRELFSSVGELLSVRLLADSAQKMKGYAFCEYGNAAKAMEALEGFDYNGHELRVRCAIEVLRERGLTQPQPWFDRMLSAKGSPESETTASYPHRSSRSVPSVARETIERAPSERDPSEEARNKSDVWERLFDERRVEYYWNHSTGGSSWDPPRCGFWQRSTGARAGAHYFYHNISGKSRWELPSVAYVHAHPAEIADPPVVARPTQARAPKLQLKACPKSKMLGREDEDASEPSSDQLPAYVRWAPWQDNEGDDDDRRKRLREV